MSLKKKDKVANVIIMLLFLKKNKNFISTAKQLTVNITNFLQKIVDFSPNLWYLVVTQEVGYKKTNSKEFAYVNIGAITKVIQNS